MAMTRVELVNVSKKFGDFVAVNNVSLSVNPGEFLVLLGPSGSGKTTLLRMIAGLIRETSGDILINGRNVKGIPPYKRNIGFVFQDRALFSHMSVIENVAFGLRMRGLPKSERYKRARELLEMVHLTHYENRSPRLLSGGEQQRVALTRALALNPVLLLLDEPLSSLDRKLRIEMRGEVKSIQQKVGITTVYVTHDQKEALSMADRVVIFNSGKVEQVGSPTEIYDCPQSKFVAEFIGDMNFFRAKVLQRGRESCLVLIEDMKVECRIPNRRLRTSDQRLLIGIRPERIRIDSPVPKGDDIQGDVDSATYQGDIVNYKVLIGENPQSVAITQVRKAGEEVHSAGEKVSIKWSPEDIVVLTP